MDENFLEPRLDLMPRQRIIVEIGDRSLQSRTVAAGDMDGPPENSGGFDSGYLPQPARGLVNGLPGGLVSDQTGIAHHLIGRALCHNVAVRKVNDALAALRLVHVMGRDQGSQTFRGHIMNEVPELATGVRIDAGGGLVEQ